MNQEITHLNDDEIDLKDLFNILWSEKFLIAFITIIFALGSVYYSLQQPNIFEASALVVVSDNQSSSASMGGQISGVASSLGIALPGEQGDKSALALETLKSKGFLKVLLEIPDIKKNLFAIKSYDIDTNTISYDETVFNTKKNTWLRTPIAGRQVEPSYVEIHDSIQDSLKIIKDTKSGFITISFAHLSPIFANDFINIIVNEVNKTSSARDIKEAQKAIEYLNIQYENSNVREIKQSISTLIQSQLEILMLANIKEDYLIRFIDPPFIPEIKSYPNRKIICIIGTILGFLLGIFLVFFKKFFLSK